MDMTPNQQSMIALANGYWAYQRIQSPEQLAQWQERSYIPENVREQMHGRELNDAEQTKLATLFNANSTHFIQDVIGHHLKNTLKACYERGENVASSYEVASTLVYLPHALERALNPIGREDYAGESMPIALLAIKALSAKTKQFPTANYEAYPAYALEVLAPYLPNEYVKLLRFEFEPKQQAPATDVDIGSIDLSTDRLIKDIAQGKGSSK